MLNLTIVDRSGSTTIDFDVFVDKITQRVVEKLTNNDLIKSQSKEDEIPPGMPEGLISRQKVIASWGVKNNYLNDKIKEYKIPTYRFGKKVYYREEDLKKLFEPVVRGIIR